MRDHLLVIRGLIDRSGAAQCFRFPEPSQVEAGSLPGAAWPTNPWTGARMTPGRTRGHYRYDVSTDRRAYRLIGYLSQGVFAVGGGMPRAVKRAYDHRGEEGLNLIRQYVEQWARAHGGRYPAAAEVAADAAVGRQAGCSYWPSNPWDHGYMEQRGDRGSFSYWVATDHSSYVLRLHRALRRDYVLKNELAGSLWPRLLARLEDDILERNGRVLATYVDQWARQHGGVLPAPRDLSPGGAVAAAHSDWPWDPLACAAMRQGLAPGTYTYAPAKAGAYVLTVHLHAGDYEAGGMAPSP